MESFFNDWKSSDLHMNQLFITDGIVDKDKWNQSETKIMFLLKEAYDSKRKEGTWDLPKYIQRKKVSGRTLKPMAQWACGVSHVINDKEIYSYQASGEDVEHALLSSAIINLKKSQGKHKSNHNDLKLYVETDWHFIKKQIEVIKPTIIICGNTWGLIKDKLSYNKISDRAYMSDNIIYIDYWHPANRASNKMNYYALCALVQLAVKAPNSQESIMA